MEKLVYLDHNATTPVRPEAIAAIDHTLLLWGNPSSVHGGGRAARRIIEDARERVAALVGADPSQVIFTSGGTEANALGLSQTDGEQPLLVAATEHASVLENAPGGQVVPVDGDGIVDLWALEEILSSSKRPALVAVMLANNETGVIQPIAEVVDIARRFGARVHCDAVQAAGKIPLQWAELGVDMLALSAHKLGGPMGVGALVVAPGTRIHALIRGGGQERRHRSGTENLAGIAGFGAAAALARDANEAVRLRRLRDRLEAAVTAIEPGTVVFSRQQPRLPNTSCFAAPGPPAETMVIALDLIGVAVSAGAACSSGKVSASHVLRAMGVAHDRASRAIRVSLGWTSDERDVVRFVQAWAAARSRVAGGQVAADRMVVV